MQLIEHISVTGLWQVVQQSAAVFDLAVTKAFVAIGFAAAQDRAGLKAAGLKAKVARWSNSKTLRLAPRPDKRAGQTAATVPPRLSLEAQFARVTAIVETARTTSASISRLEQAAQTKIDAAEYALDRMLDELNSVMPQINLPVRTADPRPVLVHVGCPQELAEAA